MCIRDRLYHVVWQAAAGNTQPLQARKTDSSGIRSRTVALGSLPSSGPQAQRGVCASATAFAHLLELAQRACSAPTASHLSLQTFGAGALLAAAPGGAGRDAQASLHTQLGLLRTAAAETFSTVQCTGHDSDLPSHTGGSQHFCRRGYAADVGAD
eukprot:5854738-Pyramimonas_sp.AAC.1